WYNGEGTDAYAYVRDIWANLKSQRAPGDSFFPNIPNLGDPQSLPGFPNTIYSKITVPKWATATSDELIQAGAYSLRIIKENSQRIHKWDFAKNLAEDITDSIKVTALSVIPLPPDKFQVQVSSIQPTVIIQA